MSDLKWIPMSPGSIPPQPRRYLVLWSDGLVGIEGISSRPLGRAAKVTHYCPIPEPVMPEEEPQDCPFCGVAPTVYLNYVQCLHSVGCYLQGPLGDDEADGIRKWNRIRLAPEGGES